LASVMNPVLFLATVLINIDKFPASYTSSDMKKIGMLTIGQSPRTDILPGFIEILGEGYKVVEVGALDELTLKDIEQIDFRPDDYLLVSRMRDGTEIRITKRFVLPLVQGKIRELEDAGVDITVIMCTGKFPQFDSRGLIVTPQEIIKGVLKGTIKRGRLGVVYPAKEQRAKASSDYGREGVQVYADYLSPYRGLDEVEQLARRLSEQSLDLVLLNCFGFSSEVRRVVAEMTGVPVIQSNALVARVLKSLV
jgi:protein AroM